MSDESKTKKPEAAPGALHGLLAEYENPEALISAAAKVRDAGYRDWDTFTPFPVHGIDQAMGIKMTILPVLVLCGGLTGCVVALLLQWYTNTFDYPWLISGKPFFSVPANIPVTFELTVLLSAFAAFFGMLALNKLPHPSHSLDHVRSFARVSDDRFFLLIQASDPTFDGSGTKALLEQSGAVGVVDVPEDTTTPADLPRGILYVLLILGAAATVPLAVAALARENTSDKPRIHVIGDMDWQKKFKSQRANTMFEDKRAMRPEVEGTVAVGELREDDHFYKGKNPDGSWARTFPSQVKVDAAAVERGKERFGIYCAPCHGYTGLGDGMISRRAQKLAEGTWTPPSFLIEERLRLMPVGQIFSSISNGVRNMPAYRNVDPEDRWAIILYLRALQRSRAGKITDVPEEARGSL